MAFTKKPEPVFITKLEIPDRRAFHGFQLNYLYQLIRSIEQGFGSCFRESRRVLSPDGNPARILLSLNGKSGSFRVDLGVSQFALGSSVLILAESLTGNATITGIDNAYPYTSVFVVNRDGSNTLTVQHNSEILTDSGADITLNQNDVVSFMQINNGPLWLQTSTVITNA